MKIKPIKQKDANACGPACIEMTLKYFQIPITAKEISNVTNYKKEGGMYNNQLVDALNKFGLKTRIHKNTSWEMLKEIALDEVAILSWMLDGYIGHFSVLEKVSDTHVFLAEPTTGKLMKVEKIKFLRLWLDYEARGTGVWYPEKNSDIQLRWMVVVSK